VQNPIGIRVTTPTTPKLSSLLPDIQRSCPLAFATTPKAPFRHSSRDADHPPRGGERTDFMYTLIVSRKMNDIDPQAWMADVLARMHDITVSRLPELLPWNWKVMQEAVKAA